MGAEKDLKTGKWLIQYRYTDWQGIRKKSMRRGFDTKKQAEEWVRDFLSSKQGDLEMTFSSLVELYFEDMNHRLREHTLINKKYIINDKILPYFGSLKVNSIKPTDIRKWQNELISKGYKPTYLKSIHNQLSTIFNYAVNFYDLKLNPCKKAGSIGKSKADEMGFWIKEEFQKFSDCIMDKHDSYIAFNVLYWTGIRVGELLAITKSDIDFEDKTLRINKSYQRLKGKDVITPPKTPKSNRVISLPNSLVDDLKEYIERLFGVSDDDRIFFFTKHYLTNEMKRGIKESGVKSIRVHDLRHSHASALIDLGFTPVAIANRLGHEKIETTLNTYTKLFPHVQGEIAKQLNIQREDGWIDFDDEE